MTSLTLQTPCKINLLLNVLRRREDGFHDLETVMLPLPQLTDSLDLRQQASGVTLTCNHPELPTDHRNLVHRAATQFLVTLGTTQGVAIHLEKRLPLSAGLGAGSANAAGTLLALNTLWGNPIAPDRLAQLAAELGSDVPFFLQSSPALAEGRGERLQPLPPLPALHGLGLVLFHPGFGVATPWAYQSLVQHPDLLPGRPGRAQALIQALQSPSLDTSSLSSLLFNSLEAPVLRKYPLLSVIQDFFRAHGALATLMSGSGSTTFALLSSPAAAAELALQTRTHFGTAGWIAHLPLCPSAPL